MKNVVISVGPIPARVDSVKFITNRFKGGLALKTATMLTERHKVTVIAWQYTEIPEDNPFVEIIRVKDVYEYYDWFVANAGNYDAFIMAAAVANLTPVKPYETKFPSHLYKPGDEFDIRFTIAPRAIDAIKPLNPRCCLIGYKLFDAASDDELVDIARHTLADAKANLIFANTPATAKSRKLAVTSDDAVIPCTFERHVDLINQAIENEYYRTNVTPLTKEQTDNPDFREALATVKMFEHTFNDFGTVAVPVKGRPGMFATTARGHTGDPVIVYSVDNGAHIVNASGKATLNAPALSALLTPETIVVHRHEGDPNYNLPAPEDEDSDVEEAYLFPGTLEEAELVRNCAEAGQTIVRIAHHGYLKRMPIQPVDWTKYYQQFPERYFSTPDVMEQVIQEIESRPGACTLEVACNHKTTATYAYDKFVKAEGAININWDDIAKYHFDLIYIRNALNYLTMDEIKFLANHCNRFIANTFRYAPYERLRPNEATVHIVKSSTTGKDNKLMHTLRLPDDSVVRHEIYVHYPTEYELAGFRLAMYKNNSMLVFKNIDDPDIVALVARESE